MVGATYRNWRFPFYLLANYNRQYLEAKKAAMYRERDYIHATNTIPVANTRTVTLAEYNQQIAEDENRADVAPVL